jgi:hypothetical protein
MGGDLIQMPNHLNQTQERAIISACANAGISICKVLEIVCKSSEQIARMNLETHICGVSMIRFFLVRSGKATKTDAIITEIDNTYFARVEVKPGIIVNKMLRPGQQKILFKADTFNNVKGILICSTHASTIRLMMLNSFGNIKAMARD